MASQRVRHKIRAPRGGRKFTDVGTFDENWNVLKSALTEIHTRNASGICFESIYRASYRITLLGQGEQLYGTVKELERRWLRENTHQNIAASLQPILKHATPENFKDLNDSNELQAAGEKFMEALKDQWEDYQLCMSMITDVLMYMDRTVAVEVKPALPSIYSTAMQLFRKEILASWADPEDLGLQSDTLTILESTILFMTLLERNGMMIDRTLVHHCARMLEHLFQSTAEESGATLYAEFEARFLKESTEFYKDEGKRILEAGNAAVFCQKATERIAEEIERTKTTLSESTELKILAVIDEHLIGCNMKDVVALEGGVKQMVDEMQFKELHDIYTLNARVDKKKEALTGALRDKIVAIGMEINNVSLIPTTVATSQAETDGKKGKEKERPVNQQTALAIKWVEDILSLRRQFTRMLHESFQSDNVLERSIDISFAEFVNKHPRGSEYLSLFFDENLKKGVKGKTENEIDTLLENGITMLRFIRDKDLFETYYKKHLARRLLMKRSASMDIERQMISKMKLEVGNQFTQRIESMFKDINISEEMSAAYKKHMDAVSDPNEKRCDLDMSVLAGTIWPLETLASNQAVADACIYPPELDSIKKSYEQFYYNKHNGRHLSWQPTMGSADIRATFRRKNGKVQRYELNVSTYALMILLQFNDLPDDQSLTYEDLQTRTMIPEPELIRNLQSLAVAPKTRVLRKEPMSKGVNPNDKFSFNSEFTSPFIKIRIGVVSGSSNKAESADQRKVTEKKMAEERTGVIESALVRIMKQRKKLMHTQLITETLAMLSARFVPDVSMIKKRIESLIDREYLERISNDPPTYGYVA